MPYNPGVTDRSGELIAQGMMQGANNAFDGINRGMEIYFGQKMKDEDEAEKQAEKEASQKQYLDGVDLVAKSDPHGTLASIMGNKSAHEIGYDGVRGMMETSGEMAKIGRQLLEQSQFAGMEAQRKAGVEALSEFDGDMQAFTRSLVDKGVRDPEAIKTYQGLVETMTDAGWKPEKFDVDGTMMVSTSPNSAQVVKPDEVTGEPGKSIPVGDTGFHVVDLGNGKRQIIDTRTRNKMDIMDLFLAKNAGVISEDQLQELIRAQMGEVSKAGSVAGNLEPNSFFNDL